MAFVKGSLGDNQKVKEYTDGLEGRVDSAFKEVESLDRQTMPQSIMQNGWNTHFTVFATLDQQGRVHLGGRVNSGDASLGKTIFNLPAKYRPTREVSFVVGDQRFITIYTNGNIVGTGSGGGFSLDGVTYVK